MTRTISTVLLAVAFAASGACGRIAPPPVTAPPGRYADVRGLRLYYEVQGSGPPLLLLHGGGGNGEQFAGQVPAFVPRFTVVVPDMCSQGRTSMRPGPLSYHDMAEDAVALMDLLGARRFDVMGWSDGGIEGIDIAIHHPGRVGHLVTFGANFAPDGLNDDDVQWNARATAASFGEGMRAAWTRLAPEPGRYEEAMEKMLAMWRTEPRFTPAELTSIRARTLICAGENDLVRRDHTEALARAIPGASLWIVPGATHSAMVEKPVEVNARVLAFLTAP